jgi:hypothetical protein
MWAKLIAALLLTLACVGGAWLSKHVYEREPMTRQAWLALALVAAVLFLVLYLLILIMSLTF